MENLEYLNVNPDIEGFLAKDGVQFNGVVFLMREPNTGGEKADRFWFKDCLMNPIPKDKDERAYQGNFTTYKNKFVRLLSYVYPKKEKDERICEMEHCAYFNLWSESGYAQMSEDYIALRDDQNDCRFRFEQILAYCKEGIRAGHENNTLHIFTCWDIADALQKHIIIPDLTKENGVTFERGKEEHQKRQKRGYVRFNHLGLDVHIYAIDHPSYSSHVCVKGE